MKPFRGPAGAVYRNAADDRSMNKDSGGDPLALLTRRGLELVPPSAGDIVTAQSRFGGEDTRIFRVLAMNASHVAVETVHPADRSRILLSVAGYRFYEASELLEAMKGG